MSSARRQGEHRPEAERPSGTLLLDLEERLRRCERNLLAIFDGTSDGILIHRDLRYVYANDAALAMLGRRREELIGRSPFEIVPQRFRAVLAERIMEAYTTHRPLPEVEERLLHASGAEVPVEAVTIPVIFRGELSTLVHVRNITTRRELEVRLRAADRLASAGLVAAGVVHEIASPLTYALANLEVFEERCTARGVLDDELRQLLATVREGVGRACDFARDTRVFTTARSTRPGPIDIHAVLRSALAFLGPEMRSRAHVREDFGDVPKVLGNASRLAQIFLNLLANAVQSLSEDHSRRPKDVTITTKAKGASLIVVEVKDTGVGIAPELLSTIFEPLFTTKAEGSGIGLAVCRELVGLEGGELGVESVVGVGTTFTVTLRAAPRDVVEPSEPARARTVGKRILVVDDEPRLARSLKMVLSDHHTTLAHSGHDALQRLHAGERYDVVICDLLMDNIDGIDLWKRIGMEWPDLQHRMIFLTGDAFICRTQEFLSSVPNRRLQKPFAPDELLDAVDEVLSEAQASAS